MAEQYAKGRDLEYLQALAKLLEAPVVFDGIPVSHLIHKLDVDVLVQLIFDCGNSGQLLEAVPRCNSASYVSCSPSP